jgi:hypothetical protein
MQFRGLCSMQRCRPLIAYRSFCRNLCVWFLHWFCFGVIFNDWCPSLRPCRHRCNYNAHLVRTLSLFDRLWEPTIRLHWRPNQRRYLWEILNFVCIWHRPHLFDSINLIELPRDDWVRVREWGWRSRFSSDCRLWSSWQVLPRGHHHLLQGRNSDSA